MVFVIQQKSVCSTNERSYLFIMRSMLRVSTSESMIPRPCFQYCKHRLLTVLLHVYSLPYLFRLLLPLIYIHTTCISLSLRRTSAPIHLTSVLGVLGTQETSCIVIAGLLERDIFDLFLPEFDKPWVIHLREKLLLFYKPLLLEAQHCLQE